jgi:hypothetical protein
MKPVYLQAAEQIKLPLMAAFNQNFSFVDLFAGIGGFRIALEKLGGFCLGYSEIDSQAIRVYKNIAFPTVMRYSNSNGQTSYEYLFESLVI